MSEEIRLPNLPTPKSLGGFSHFIFNEIHIIGVWRQVSSYIGSDSVPVTRGVLTVSPSITTKRMEYLQKPTIVPITGIGDMAILLKDVPLGTPVVCKGKLHTFGIDSKPNSTVLVTSVNATSIINSTSVSGTFIAKSFHHHIQKCKDKINGNDVYRFVLGLESKDEMESFKTVCYSTPTTKGIFESFFNDNINFHRRRLFVNGPMRWTWQKDGARWLNCPICYVETLCPVPNANPRLDSFSKAVIDRDRKLLTEKIKKVFKGKS